MANLNVVITETISEKNQISLVASISDATTASYFDYFCIATLNTIMPRCMVVRNIKRRADWDYNKPETNAYISWETCLFSNEGHSNKTVKEIETLINEIGIFEFFKTLGDNTGGDMYKTCIRLVEGYKSYLKTGKRASIGADLSEFQSGILPDCCDRSMEELGTWAETYIPHFHFTYIAPFQKHGETYRDGWVKNKKGVIRRYRELVQY